MKGKVKFCQNCVHALLTTNNEGKVIIFCENPKITKQFNRIPPVFISRGDRKLCGLDGLYYEEISFEDEKIKITH